MFPYDRSLKSSHSPPSLEMHETAWTLVSRSRRGTALKASLQAALQRILICYSSYRMILVRAEVTRNPLVRYPEVTIYITPLKTILCLLPEISKQY